MTGPQDPAAAGRDRLRAGHADRDHVIDALKDAFVDGRLTRDEFGARAGWALAARTRADLAALTGDLPPVAVKPAPVLPAPARRWPLVRAAAKSCLCLVLSFAAVLTAAPFDPDGPGPNPSHTWAMLFLLLALALVITAFGILANGAAAAVEQRHARRHPPPRRTATPGDSVLQPANPS